MAETGRVAGKVALITGAASDLGKAAATLMVREGAHVMLADINEAAGRAVADLIGLSDYCPEALDCYRTVRAIALRQHAGLPLVGVGGPLTKGTPGDIVLPVAGGARGESPRRPHPNQFAIRRFTIPRSASD